MRKARRGGGARGRGTLGGAGGGHPCQAAPSAETGAALPGQGRLGGLVVRGGLWPPEDTVSVRAGFCRLLPP